jgi:hypothetical protein
MAGVVSEWGFDISHFCLEMAIGMPLTKLEVSRILGMFGV